jgi:transposase-like protein
MVAKKEKLVFTCEVCNRSFEVHPYRAKEPVRCCSQDCYHKWRKGKSFSPSVLADLAQLAEKYTSGMTLSQIAQEYGVSLQAVAYRLKQAGVKSRPLKGRKPSAATIERARQANIGRPSPRRKNLPQEELCAAYEAGDSSEMIARRYDVSDNVIRRRLHEAGIQLRPAGYTKLICTCADGHVVKSRWEQVVDDWLFSHGITHEIQPSCPWSNKSLWFHGDFRVGETFIEVWGIEGNAKYDQRRLDKIAKYREHAVRLIEIFPHHILDQDFSPLHCLLP